MVTARNPLEPILAHVRGAAGLSRRMSIKHLAQTYRRDGRILLYWCFPSGRPTVQAALAAPQDPAATRRLCRALWRDLQTAKTLPHYLTGRAARIASLRTLFACECALYRRQRRAAKRTETERPLMMGGWLTDLCRTIEESPATPRTGPGPRGESARQSAIIRARSRAPVAGTGNTRRR